MPAITTKSEHTGRSPKLLRRFVPFSGSGTSRHTRSSVGFITITYGFRFSVQTASMPFMTQRARSLRGYNSLGQRATAFCHWAKSLVSGNGPCNLKYIPFAFRFRRRLDLQQIHWVDFPAVFANGSFSEQRIVGWHRLHGRDHGTAVGRGAHPFDRFEIVQYTGVDTGLHMIWHHLFWMPFLITFRPYAALVIHVPIPCVKCGQALRGLQSDSGDALQIENK